jgi:hypothetical protein
MTSHLFIRSLVKVSVLLLVEFLCPGSGEVSSQTISPRGIGFIWMPVGQGHSSSPCDKAAWVNPSATTIQPHDFVIKDSHFTGNSGSQFIRWLRDDRKAVVARVYWLSGLGCPSTNPCCTIPIEQVGLDQFVVDTSTGLVVSSPTTVFRNKQGHEQAYFYSEALQPIYRGNTTEVTGFVLVTHRDVSRSGTEIWQISPDGTPVKRLVSQDVGGHGCMVSPDHQYLACERLNAVEWYRKGFLLISIDGTQTVDVKWGEFMPIGLAVWSSDSAGFVFYACKTPNGYSCSANGWLVYYDILRKTYIPLAPDWMPSFFCSQYAALCRPYGTSNIGSDMPTASPVPGWFYYSALIGLTNGSKPRRVVGRVSRDKSAIFEPLTLTQLQEAGHPTVSPSGKVVAFTASLSESDYRAALYTADVCTHEIRPMGALQSGKEVYIPLYRDRVMVTNAKCELSSANSELTK